MTKATKKTTKKSKAVTTTNNVPAYINQSESRGSENVGVDDMVIPRIELAQDLSPCIKKSKAEYIEGATVGVIYNSVTRELYEDGLFFVPVLFKKEYLIWKDRKEGGGFRGNFPTIVDAEAEIRKIKVDAPGTYEAVETAQHICLIIVGDRVEEAVISMSRSKLKISRAFNSVIRVVGGDRFSRMYKLTSVEDSSDLGEYQNFKITPAKFPTEPVYKRAEKLYTDIVSGLVKAEVDTTFDNDGSDDSDDAPNTPNTPNTAGNAETPF